MRAVNVPRGLGFDASVEVTPEIATLFLMSGYKYCVRYLRRDIHVNERTDQSWPCSLSRHELAALLQTGMNVSLVQFFSNHPLSPGYGTKIGTAAAENAKLLGAPKGITVWLDAEWSRNLPTKAQAWQYMTEWAEPVRAAGYEPGIYVGCGIPLGLDLYALPHYRHYWRAASIVPQVRKRGFQMIQGMPQTVHGIEIDPDVSALDHLGDRFKVIGP